MEDYFYGILSTMNVVLHKEISSGFIEERQMDNNEEVISSKGLLIKGSDFVLKAISESSTMFDLYLLKTVNEGKENERKEFRVEGYGMSIAHCLTKIIQYRVYNRLPKIITKDDQSLIMYFRLWEAEKQRLLKLFDLSPDDWRVAVKVKKAIIEERIEKEVAAEEEKEKAKAERKAARQEAKKAAKKKTTSVKEEESE
jgi:hypothetical protein